MFTVLYVWLERCKRVCCSLPCGVNSTFLEALSLDICGHMPLCGVCLSHSLYVYLFITICFGESVYSVLTCSWLDGRALLSLSN